MRKSILLFVLFSVLHISMLYAQGYVVNGHMCFCSGKSYNEWCNYRYGW